MKLEEQNNSKSPSAPIAILGVPFDNVTTAEAISLIEGMIASRRPHYLVTANVDFLVQALHDVELRRIIFEAHLVLCDGTPLVWASRLLGNPLPERVAGSDLVPLLIRVAAEKKYRLFFLGGSTESTETAIKKLEASYPPLIVAGHYSPPFSNLLEMDHDEIKRRIQAARPDLLFVCFGCPKQEKWMGMHYRSLDVPVSVGVGGTIDFLAGRLARAPHWMQRTGLEWTFRLGQEPRRLFARYLKDLWYFSGSLLAQWWQLQFHSRRRPALNSTPRVEPKESGQQIQMPEWLDKETVERSSLSWENALATHRFCLLELDRVKFIDSTGVGLLIRLQKRARIGGRQLVLVAPSAAVRRALTSMHLDSFFEIASDIDTANQLAASPASHSPLVKPNLEPSTSSLAWHGEVTAANASEIWDVTERFIQCQAPCQRAIEIDLSGLRFIDSTGVSLMIRSKKKALQQGVRLAFIRPAADVRNVLRLSRLEDYLLETRP